MSKIEMRPIADLKPHPKNQELFPKLNPAGLRRLANDILENGLQHPIEILSDGTILRGHQRVLAYQLLGRDNIPCKVIAKLDAASSEKILQYLIRDNLSRRQLNHLGVARALQREYESKLSDRGLRPGRFDMVSTLAQMLGMTERNARRYFTVLETPLVIQTAFEVGELTLQLATRVAALTPKRLKDLSREIEKGAQIRAAVVAAVRHRSKRPVEVDVQLAAVQQAVTAMDELSDWMTNGGQLNDDYRDAVVKSLDVLTTAVSAD